jgi:tRNA pseudouridine38-40 synthase
VTSNDAVSEPAAPDRGGGLVRLRLDLGYDGTGFAGWAAQPGQRTVAGVLEEALMTALRAAEPPPLVVAGRTDAGVHATGQVAHVDVPGPVDPAVLARQLAGLLPEDVGIRGVNLAPAGFDARFAALGRRYRYRVADRAPNPLRRRDTLSWPRPLDAEGMHVAAQHLVGEHDFAAYCRARAGATTIRVLRAFAVERDADEVVVIAAFGDAFCHHQVRSMVGALLAVGEGRRAVDWPAEVLAGGVRDSAVNVAPAHGLTLVGVDYPPDHELVVRASQTRRRRRPPG